MFREKSKLELAKEELRELIFIWILIILFLFLSIIYSPIPKINMDKNFSLLTPIILLQTILIMMMHFHQAITRSFLFPPFYLIINLVIGYFTISSLRDYYRIKKKSKPTFWITPIIYDNENDGDYEDTGEK